MKIYYESCAELKANGGILKDSHGTHYYKPNYIAHREDGHTSEWTNGIKSWYYEGRWIMRTEGDVTPEQLLDFKLRIL